MFRDVTLGQATIVYDDVVGNVVSLSSYELPITD